MKTKKITHYRLGVSRHFPAKHPKKGEITEFVDKITLASMRDRNKDLTIRAQSPTGELVPKLHTIRANYDLWKKRFKKINKGEAVLDLFYWSGKPYRSKQIAFATLTMDDGIGLQMLEFTSKGFDSMPIINGWIGDSEDYSFGELAKNDGLSLEDWEAWFKGYDLSKPLAIIHFTSFRY